MAVMVGIVIVGGIRSIGAVAGRIVPFMCMAYVVAALYILAVNASDIPAAFQKIFVEAFSPNAAFGGFLGIVVIGIQRAVFSNEAGVGSAAIAHSAAKTDEPVSEGIVALLEPFIDTVVVCTITALVVIVTGAYEAPEMKDAIADSQGAKLTLYAFITGGHDWFRYILYLAVVLFAYSTCISWSYYGERCWVELFGARTSIVYKVLFLGFTILGSIITRGNVLAFSDLMILGMSFPNLLGVFILSGMVKRQLDLYWGKYKRGEIARAEDA
jgi:AGCS family alanine or glycine:cation symporter